jgi:hypothetical protein
MINCKICEKEFKSEVAIASHVRQGHHISSIIYYNKYNKKDGDGICKMFGIVDNCKKYTTFISLEKGYRSFCCARCSTLCDETQKKKKKSLIKKYGVDHQLKAKVVKEQIKQTCMKRYNVDNPAKLKEVQQTKRNNFLSKPIEEQQKIVSNSKKKRDITNLKKYGDEEIFRTNYFFKKREETSIEKYGELHPCKSDIVKNNIKKTNLERYNCKHVFQVDKYKEKIKKSISIKTKIKLSKLLEVLDLELLSKYENNLIDLKLRCKKCNREYYKSYFNLQQGCHPCYICNPPLNGTSKDEIELLEFIKNDLGLKALSDNRIIIKPKELDIVIPTKKIAIEYNGLYWHSTAFNKDPNLEDYHLNKTIECEKKNFRLIHIFEDEWLLKKNIIKGKLKQILKSNEKLINFEEYKIKEISNKSKDKFLSKYHTEGKDISNVNIGAFYKEQLIAVMSFINLENYIWKLNRFCMEFNYSTLNILERIFNQFKENHNWRKIYFYIDRRWTDIELGYKLGFNLDKVTKPNVWYIKGLNRYSKSELKSCYNDINLISDNFLKKNGIDKIWDCGNYKFSLENINKNGDTKIDILLI